MSENKECIDVCNSLLRGELSAVETYTQAIEKAGAHESAPVLEDLRADHERSAAVLREHLVGMGAEPSESSGVWGAFAKAVEGTAKVFGESTALSALEAGEEHGISEYRDALKNDGVMEDIKTEIQSTLLPRLEDHLSILKGLQAP